MRILLLNSEEQVFQARISFEVTVIAYQPVLFQSKKTKGCYFQLITELFV